MTAFTSSTAILDGIPPRSSVGTIYIVESLSEATLAPIASRASVGSIDLELLEVGAEVGNIPSNASVASTIDIEDRDVAQIEGIPPRSRVGDVTVIVDVAAELPGIPPRTTSGVDQVGGFEIVPLGRPTLIHRPTRSFGGAAIYDVQPVPFDAFQVHWRLASYWEIRGLNGGGALVVLLPDVLRAPVLGGPVFRIRNLSDAAVGVFDRDFRPVGSVVPFSGEASLFLLANTTSAGLWLWL